jgi:RNA polymerase sigma-70 factor (ECF subfamily)
LSAHDALPADDFRGVSRSGEDSGEYVVSAPSLRMAPRTAPKTGAGTDDADLLARARAGDRAAFGVLVERHHRALAAILRPRCGPSVPMEDLLQEVFARALAHVGTFRSDAAFLTWATSIGLNLASDWRRTAERRRRLVPTVDVDDAEPTTGDGACASRAAEARDEVERARRALDALPTKIRVAVTLRVVEDESYEEIAARMHAPLPRVRQWVCRGLKRLRATLEDRHARA